MRATALAVLAATVLAVLLVLARGAPDHVSAGDLAVIESYVLRASHGALDVGPYSRYQWHHPGPLYFYVLAPFYALAGDRPSGLALGALIINLAALSAIGWAVGRSDEPGLSAALGVFLALYVWRAREILTSSWNPHVLVIPLMALAVVAARTVSDRAWWLPVAALLASLVAQTHVGTVPVVFVLSAAAVVLAAGKRSFATAACVSGVVIVMAWLPSIVEQMRGQPGNVTELWRFFVTQHGAGQPLDGAFRAWADMMTGVVRPDFAVPHGEAFRRSRAGWTEGVAIGTLVLLVVAAGAAARKRQPFRLALAVLILLASLTALWSATRIEGAIMTHEAFWISGIGALGLAASLDGLAGLIPAARLWSRGLSRHACWLACGACAVVGLWQFVAVLDQPGVPPADAAAIQSVAGVIRDRSGAPGSARPLILIDQQAWHWAAGVLLRLQKAGVPYAVETGWLPMFTNAVAPGGHEEAGIMIAGAEQHYRNRDRPGNEVLAEHPPIFLDQAPLGP